MTFPQEHDGAPEVSFWKQETVISKSINSGPVSHWIPKSGYLLTEDRPWPLMRSLVLGKGDQDSILKTVQALPMCEIPAAQLF